jgi:predicted DNA-binding transcriptional regulator AlpA
VNEEFSEEVITAAGGLCAPVEDGPWTTNPLRPKEIVFAPRKVYGLAEVAGIVGVKRKKIRRWIDKDRLPAPTDWLADGPVWLAEAIEPWLRKYLTPVAVRDALRRFTVERGGIQFQSPPRVTGEPR